MRIYVLYGFIGLLSSFSLVSAQNASMDIGEYLETNQVILSAATNYTPSEDHRLFLFGAIHGTKLTQEADLILLKNHVESNRVRIYLPEMDGCLAYFLNNYLETGNEESLREVVS
ncbi:MAG: hypothetical protein AAGH79_06570, partial [Bacteroidota bacterium]